MARACLGSFARGTIGRSAGALALFTAAVVAALAAAATAADRGSDGSRLGTPLSARDMSAPPEDLLDGTLRLGDPPAETSRAALIPVVAIAERAPESGRDGEGHRGEVHRWRVREVVPHAGGALAIAVLIEPLPAPWSPWEVLVQAPNGSILMRGPLGGGDEQQGGSDAPDKLRRQHAPPGPISLRRGSLASLMPGAPDASDVPALRVDLDGAEPGDWIVEIVSIRAPLDEEAKRAAAEQPTPAGDGHQAGLAGPRGVIVTAPEDGHTLRCSASDWLNRIGLPKTYLLDASSEFGAGALIESVEATLTRPDGVVESLVATPAAVSFVPTQGGAHVLHATATLRTAEGWRTRRSATVVVDVADSAVALLGTGRLTPLDALRHRVELGIAEAGRRLRNGDSDGEGISDAVFVCGEVWLREIGEGGDARERPICWIGSIVEPVIGDDGVRHLPLSFDRRWLGRATEIARDKGAAPAVGARRASERGAGELSLREIRVHDRRTGSLIDRQARVDLGSAPGAIPFDPREEASLLRGRTGGHPVASTIRPAAVPISDAPIGGHALMLVHGYCSDGSPFPASHFNGAVAQFLDPNVARSNDEFAQLIAAFGADYKSYGSVAHSQGGMASLHLYAFYWSGLDWAEGPRLIQSVGCPYQGTPLAGNLAVLGGIFGVGCGSVQDMTPEGAAAWLSTIPTWARQRVWYWTTSYKDFPFSYDYCDFLSDLFLTNPDDGVIERFRGQLPGGNNMGHTEGWCHVADMEDPPQCTDLVRNTQMNANAAR